MTDYQAAQEMAKLPEPEQLLALYRQLITIRYTEEQLARSHQMGLVHGAAIPTSGRRRSPRGYVPTFAPRTPFLARTGATDTRWPRASARARLWPSSSGALPAVRRGAGEACTSSNRKSA